MRFEDILVEITLEDIPRPKVKRPDGIPVTKKDDVKPTPINVEIIPIPVESKDTTKEERLFKHRKIIEAEKERLKRKNVLKRRRTV